MSADPVCPECDTVDFFSLLTAAKCEVRPRAGEAFVCCTCISIGTHTGRGLEIRRATPAEVSAAVDDPAVVALIQTIREAHALRALPVVPA